MEHSLCKSSDDTTSEALRGYIRARDRITSEYHVTFKLIDG